MRGDEEGVVDGTETRRPEAAGTGTPESVVRLAPEDWARVVYAWQAAYVGPDGTPPPSEWFFRIGVLLRQAAGEKTP